MNPLLSNVETETDTDTEELLDLFSSTLRSLAADAAAIRQISDMADLLQHQEEEEEEAAIGSKSNSSSNNSAICESLVQLDALTTGFERKVDVLRQILNEENNALVQFETTLRKEADDQAELLNGLMAALELKETETKTNSSNSNNNSYANAQDESQNENENDDIRHRTTDDTQTTPNEAEEANEAEASVSFSSLGSNSINSSYRLSLTNATNNTNANNTSYNSNSGSWDDEGIPIPAPAPATTTKATATARCRSSLGSKSSSNSILSNESGSFTRRRGLLKSTNANANANKTKTNTTNTYRSPHHSRHATTKETTTKKKASTPYTKRTVGVRVSNENSAVFENTDALDRSSRNTNTNSHRENNNESNAIKPPSFVPVTDQELNKFTLFGPHMCRYDINEALEEIQSVLWNQLSLVESSSSSSNFGRGRISNNSNSNSNRNTYGTSNTYQQRKSGYSGFPALESPPHHHHQQSTTYNTNTHKNHRFAVSEQSLRENCAFFRHGESTARSTLQLLCSLKRLKQVPSKKSEVTYVCLFGP